MKKIPSLKTFERYLSQADSYYLFQNTIIIEKNGVKKEYPYSLFEEYIKSKTSI